MLRAPEVFPRSQTLAQQGQDQNEAELGSPARVLDIPVGPWGVFYQVV